MKKRFFPLLIALSALAVSGSAAFYSVFGLSKLFAGASTQVIIMAGSLEFAKLVVASLLYQYWDTINKFLRAYLSIACFVLMIITSGGIYGFLSGAYQTTANQSELLDKSLRILNQKQVRFQETKSDLTLEKTQINKSISDLRISLSNPTSVSWYDKNAGEVITTTSSSARRALQTELKTTIADRDNVNIKIEAVLDSINKTDMVLLDKEISNEAESELGPLKYLAETTGQDMGQVVNWFLLLIVFVFDPLAIALVIAANMAFAQLKPRVKEIVSHQPDPNPKVSVEELTEKEYEKRMNIIGQNGNDGLHYEDPTKSTLPPMSFDIPLYDPQTGELNPYYEDLTDKKLPTYFEEEELSRLTDTTQTLIVKEPKTEKETIKEIVEEFQEDDLIDEWLDELGKEKGLNSQEENLPLKKTLRYTKRK
tara:strand:- start:6761 stop:8032 length:1272 start_codon:yes stop_codon:yes gene_type:complete